MSKVYCGIDPGKKGYLVINDNNNWRYYPFLDTSIRDLSNVLRSIKESSNGNLVCAIEDVHAVFGTSAKSTFEFGLQKGLMIGLLEGNGIPYHQVPPKTWQKEMWANCDIVVKSEAFTNKSGKTGIRKKKDTKKTSENAAKRLFPDTDFRRTSKCKKNDDNKFDATLIAEYARRKNL